jgi:hypothetical protein
MKIEILCLQSRPNTSCIKKNTTNKQKKITIDNLRQTDRQIDRQTERYTEINRETDRLTEIQINKRKSRAKI